MNNINLDEFDFNDVLEDKTTYEYNKELDERFEHWKVEETKKKEDELELEEYDLDEDYDQ